MSFKLFASPHRNISRHISNIGTMSFRCTSRKLASLSSGPEPAAFIVRPDEDALPSAPPSGANPVVLSLCSICPYRRLLLPRPLGRGKEGCTRGLPATHAGGLTQASERGCTAYTRTQGTARPVCRRRLGTRPAGCQRSLPSAITNETFGRLAPGRAGDGRELGKRGLRRVRWHSIEAQTTHRSSSCPCLVGCSSLAARCYG